MRRGLKAFELPLINHALTKAAEFGFAEQRLAPDFKSAITVEVMNRHFIKYHLGRGVALHRFKSLDPGPAHDHPCDFTTLILVPYVEEIYSLEALGWTCAQVTREAGRSHAVAASIIHRIVALPAGESWTLVHYGRHVRATRFYRFGDVVESRSSRRNKWRVMA